MPFRAVDHSCIPIDVLVSYPRPIDFPLDTTHVFKMPWVDIVGISKELIRDISVRYMYIDPITCDITRVACRSGDHGIYVESKDIRLTYHIKEEMGLIRIHGGSAHISGKPTRVIISSGDAVVEDRSCLGFLKCWENASVRFPGDDAYDTFLVPMNEVISYTTRYDVQVADWVRDHSVNRAVGDECYFNALSYFNVYKVVGDDGLGYVHMIR